MEKDTKITTSFHWFHWLIVFLSILLTLFAWWFSSNQVEEKVESQFQKEADQVIELISERMQKYEDGLWGGVAAIQANGGDIAYGDWLTFATHLKIDVKYPGINGIGVIYHLRPKEIISFLKKQKSTQPNFHIHPKHEEKEYFPITYIEPSKSNAKAVGLDIAYEKSRYEAAKKARDTGLAQITGPIELVQDAEKTPGFLFYTPFYIGADDKTLEDRREYFVGLVYAPFVVKKLMQGTLLREKRRVDIQINDGDHVLYNEHVESHSNFDPDPIFKVTKKLDLYGRTWSFDIRSTKLFRATENNQPLTILVGGIIIDSLIILLFVALTRSNRKAVNYANTMTQELKEKAVHLEKSNKDLEQFSYLISHDLKAPLRGISNVLGFIEEDYGESLDKGLQSNLGMIDGLVIRSQTLLNDVLIYSSFTNKNVDEKKERVKLKDIVSEILETNSIDETKVSLSFDLQEIHCSKLLIRTILNNLIANSQKHGGSSNTADFKIHVCCESYNDKQCLFSVKDNGPGIPKGKEEHVFKIFRQLRSRDDTDGTGLGLALVKTIVSNKNCDIWVVHPEEGGVEFKFTWPK